jgi:hypothetical protein
MPGAGAKPECDSWRPRVDRTKYSWVDRSSVTTVSASDIGAIPVAGEGR